MADLVTVRCITELKPWANVHVEGKDPVLRFLLLDEEVEVPRNEGVILQKHRHAIMLNTRE